ncbi:MAG: TonB-dependent copper receptor [Sulfuricella sp.]|nr:TonB-dependent copper receptor [Sulfuricella sp.]
MKKTISENSLRNNRSGVAQCAIAYCILPLGILPLCAVAAERTAVLDEVVVTAPPALDPLTVRTDPKAPRQPVPAQDGADYLKNIPGFSSVRKGGTSGDPVFRGQAGSRLNLTMDGESVLGGCGMRMDPPTAYVYPESFDAITVLKGPQTVLHGGGNVAGTVLFERQPTRFATPGARGQASLMVGSFGRNDVAADAAAGTPEAYLRGNATRSDANDYTTGNGTVVHSSYTRWSGNLAAGWTPDPDTRVEITLDRSDARAAYADRSLDGAKFARDGYGFKLERLRLAPWLDKLEFQAYHNYVDHVMDNFSLRPVVPVNNFSYYQVSNPDRTTDGARLALQLIPAPQAKLTAGLDYQRNSHTLRAITRAVPINSGAAPYIDIDSKVRTPDMTFDNTGAFAELAWELGIQDRLVGGLRSDRLEVRNDKSSGSGAKASLSDRTQGAFLRYERDFVELPVALFAGIGRAERPADWWERNRDFYLKPESNTQLDLGAIWNGERLRASLSLFRAALNDYILVRDDNTARNIDASTHGLEADLVWNLARHWNLSGTLAWVHGDNRSDGVPLAQMPPLEGRFGATYDDRRFSYGALLRLVARQDRVHIGYGSIVGQDFGATSGFAVFSLNAAYRPKKGALISVGVDNLFNRHYAEHVNRAGSAVPGFDPILRLYEPGRNLWMKVNYALD